MRLKFVHILCKYCMLLVNLHLLGQVPVNSWKMPDVYASLDFLFDSEELHRVKPYYIFPTPESVAELPPDGKLFNVEWESRKVLIRDIRGMKDFNMDQTGAQVVRHESQHLSISDRQSLEEYQRETEEFLKSSFNAEFVHCFDFKVFIIRTQYQDAN